jgi:hypothetical protein
MGYTNYWEQPTDFNDDQWVAVMNEAEYLNTFDFISVGVFKDEIIINGGNSLSSFDSNGTCETLALPKKALTEADRRYKEQKLELHFCKTRELPYDLAVWHLLTFCQMIKKDFKCSRDGWAWEKNPQPADETLSVKFINNDQVEDNKLPMSDIKYYEMFDEDNEDKSITTWVRFKIKKGSKCKASGFITATENILNLSQIKDNLIRKSV